MDIRNIKKLRKEIKSDNYKFNIIGLWTCFVKRKDNRSVMLFSKNHKIYEMDENTLSMFLDNFKKTVSTSLNKKMFDLELKSDSFSKLITPGDTSSNDNIVKAICDSNNYPFDFAVNILDAEVTFVKKQRGEDPVYTNKRMKFITINNVEKIKNQVILDTVEKDFSTEGELKYAVNLNPIEGIIYPSLEGKNRIMYYVKSEKNLSKGDISSLLDVDFPLTATEEKENFTRILEETYGEEMSLETLTDIYRSLEERRNNSEDDAPVVNMRELIKILPDENKNVTNFNSIVGELDIDTIKIDSILPDKNIVIKDGPITVTIPCDRYEELKAQNNELKISLTNSTTVDNIDINTR